MSELKRCPFCGGEAELACRDFGGWFVRCKKCFCKTSIFFPERFATISWNTRTPMERIVERLEEPTNYTIVKGKHFTTVERAIEIVKQEGGAE